MLSKKTLAPDQITDAKRLIEMLEKLPTGKRALVVMVANAFLDGLEAKENMTANRPA